MLSHPRKEPVTLHSLQGHGRTLFICSSTRTREQGTLSNRYKMTINLLCGQHPALAEARVGTRNGFEN